MTYRRTDLKKTKFPALENNKTLHPKSHPLLSEAEARQTTNFT